MNDIIKKIKFSVLSSVSSKMIRKVIDRVNPRNTNNRVGKVSNTNNSVFSKMIRKAVEKLNPRSTNNRVGKVGNTNKRKTSNKKDGANQNIFRKSVLYFRKDTKTFRRVIGKTSKMFVRLGSSMAKIGIKTRGLLSATTILGSVFGIIRSAMSILKIDPNIAKTILHIRIALTKAFLVQGKKISPVINKILRGFLKFVRSGDFIKILDTVSRGLIILGKGIVKFFSYIPKISNFIKEGYDLIRSVLNGDLFKDIGSKIASFFNYFREKIMEGLSSLMGKMIKTLTPSNILGNIGDGLKGMFINNKKPTTTTNSNISNNTIHNNTTNNNMIPMNNNANILDVLDMFSKG